MIEVNASNSLGNTRKGMLWELFLEFLKLGALTFGGGYAMIPLIERHVVKECGWLTRQDFADLVAIAEMTPGSLIVKSSAFVGKKMCGLAGSVVATIAAILPSFLVILVIAATFLRVLGLPLVQSVFRGIDAAIVALIVAAVVSVGKTTVSDKRTLLIAAGTAIVVLIFNVHPVLALLAAGVIGIVLFR